MPGWISSRTSALGWHICGPLRSWNRYFRGPGMWPTWCYIAITHNHLLIDYWYATHRPSLPIWTMGCKTLSWLGSWNHSEFSLQPFNNKYIWANTSDNLIIPDPTISLLNGYIGGDDQQATSVVTQTGMSQPIGNWWLVTSLLVDQNCYEAPPGTGCFSVYGIEYKPGFDDAVRFLYQLAGPSDLALPIQTVYFLDSKRQTGLDNQSSRSRCWYRDWNLGTTCISRTHGEWLSDGSSVHNTETMSVS